MWPRKGTWNHSDPTTAISETSKRPIRKNGSVLPRMNSAGRMGVTMICSSVPISRSRTTAKAVSVITRTSVRLPMTPGTKNQRLLRFGVVPGPLLELDRRNLLDQLRRNAVDAVLLVVLRKAERDLRDVTRSDQRGVGVGRIHNHLQRRGLALAQLLRKAGIDLQADGRIAPVDEIANLARVGELPLHVEVRARGKARDQFAALLAVIQIEHHCRNMMNFVGGRVAKDQHLNDRRTNEDEARPLVAEDLDELLDQHLLQPPEHFYLL